MSNEVGRDRITNNWQDCEAKKRGYREASSWISPNGKWYNVPFALHEHFAYCVLKSLKPPKDVHEEIDMINDAAKTLMEDYHWLFIHDDWASGTIINGTQHMTEAQYHILLETFGDRPLFRGLTVKRMWENRKDW